MSGHNSLFSAHIYDQQRIALARTILEKETRKLFLGLPSTTWRAIDQSIQGWAEHPTQYHLEDGGPRDFWDSFAAFMEGIKLKPNFTAWITAENVRWHKMILPLQRIHMTSALTQLEKVPDLALRNDLPLAELASVLAKHPVALKEQKWLIDKHSTDPAQDSYPIIVQETADGVYKVMDGNRRTLKAVIYGQSDIEAWVGTIEGTRLTNFWVPLNDMFQLVKIFKSAVESNNQPLQQAVAKVLKAHFVASTVAKQAYQLRIGNQNEIAKRLGDLTEQQT